MKTSAARRRKTTAYPSTNMIAKLREAARRTKRLRDHLAQLESLEVVMAVVGTMKSGKSSCINALLGCDLLPNRNRPMTSIPTLVRHQDGAMTPVMTFHNTAPVQRLVGKLGTALKRASATRSATIASDKDLNQLAKRIKRGFTIKERYRGQSEIFNFLSSLNDLVRISEIFKIAFPFDEFKGLHDFPQIEVAFRHLPPHDLLVQRGRIALLDTPGFNEAGVSKNLRKLVNEQLQRANAVLAVLDFTQLKSEAEAELIAELREIAGKAQGRAFALVNKFDRKTENCDGAAATTAYVCNVLLGGMIPEERIFTVSATLAVLSQRAGTELASEGGLKWTARRATDWRDDFGKAAFGPRYAGFINDTYAVTQACHELWTQSGFEFPVKEVLQFSQLSAVKFVAHSTLDQLQAISDLLEETTAVAHP